MSFIGSESSDPISIVRRQWNWLIAGPASPATPPSPGTVALMLHWDDPLQPLKDSGPSNLVPTGINGFFVPNLDTTFFTSAPSSMFFYGAFGSVVPQGQWYDTVNVPGNPNSILDFKDKLWTIEGSWFSSDQEPIVGTAVVLCAHCEFASAFNNNPGIQFIFTCSSFVGFRFKACSGATEYVITIPYDGRPETVPFNFAIQRTTSAIEMFLDGVLVGSVAIAANVVLNAPASGVGWNFGVAGTMRLVGAWWGPVDEFRVTIDAALYPASGYTPAFPLLPL